MRKGRYGPLDLKTIYDFIGDFQFDLNVILNISIDIDLSVEKKIISLRENFHLLDEFVIDKKIEALKSIENYISGIDLVSDDLSRFVGEEVASVVIESTKLWYEISQYK